MPMLRRHDPNDATGPTDPAPTDAHAHTSLLGQALIAWTRLCLRAPMAIVLGAVISAVIAGAYTAQSLGYKVSRVDLLDRVGNLEAEDARRIDQALRMLA